jgi:hypothetical protein
VTKPSDTGARIYVKVTASKGSSSSAAVTSPALLIANLKAPNASISGSGTVGALLTASPAANASTTVSYQWYRTGKKITGATSSTYLPTSLDYLKSISLTTEVRQDGFPIATSSSMSTLIQAGNFVKPVVTILGTATMGNELLIGFDMPEGAKATYQWYRDSTPISGGTRTNYFVKSSDVGASLSVKVTFTKTAFNPVTVSSASIKVSAGELTLQPLPTISGTGEINKSLTGIIGKWDTGVKVSYQWLRNGIAIDNSTAKTFRVTSLDKGSAITFRISVSKAGFKTVVSTSPAFQIPIR